MWALSKSDCTRRWRYALLLLFILLLLLPGCSREAKKLKVGDQAPSFSLEDIEGKTFSLADMQGSPVIIRFFLTDCTYCRADTPVFNKLYSRFHGKGLQVLYIDSLGINFKEVKAFARELGILFPVAQDTGKAVSTSYQVRALPQTIVLDPNHKIIAAILGGVSEPELMALLSPYIAEETEGR